MEKINTLKWKDVLAQTSKELTEVSYRTWFLPLVPLEMDEEKGIIYFGAHSYDYTYELCIPMNTEEAE